MGGLGYNVWMSQLAEYFAKAEWKYLQGEGLVEDKWKFN